MGGIVTRVARAKAAEWEEAKIVRRNTVDNAMLVQISADVIATARKPTAQDASGSYRVVDSAGIYWGTNYVGVNWCGEKFVTEADSRDGLPR